jgi:hypothetical protein
MIEYYEIIIKINTLAGRHYSQIKMLLVVCLFLSPLNIIINKKHNICADLTF